MTEHQSKLGFPRAESVAGGEAEKSLPGALEGSERYTTHKLAAEERGGCSVRVNAAGEAAGNSSRLKGCEMGAHADGSGGQAIG